MIYWKRCTRHRRYHDWSRSHLVIGGRAGTKGEVSSIQKYLERTAFPETVLDDEQFLYHQRATKVGFSG